MEVDDSTPAAVRQGGKKKYTIGVNGLSVAREGMEVANPLKDGQSKFAYCNTIKHASHAKKFRKLEHGNIPRASLLTKITESFLAVIILTFKYKNQFFSLSYRVFI